MTEAELQSINAIRRRKGLPQLSRYMATQAAATHPRRDDPGFDSTGFLIGYMTGIPMPSAGGIMGSMMHDSGSHHSAPSSSSASFSGGGGSFGGGGASSSWSDSSSSSSDSSSSSSSSSDSGSSSGGGGGD